MAGLATAWYIYTQKPEIARNLAIKFDWAHFILDRKYGFDEFNQAVFAGGSKLLGKFLWLVGDRAVIDGLVVNGSAHSVGWFAMVCAPCADRHALPVRDGDDHRPDGLLGWFVLRHKCRLLRSFELSGVETTAGDAEVTGERPARLGAGRR